MLKFQQTEAFVNNFIEILTECRLFLGVDRDNLCKMIGCLGAKTKKFTKDQFILSEGNEAKHVGVVLSGEAQIIRTDLFGNRTILARVVPSQLFGESFACADMKSIPINVVATSDCEVMLIDAKRITQTCNGACEFHSKMIYNLLKVVAEKNIIFHEKIEITSKRTTREKLMTYLQIQAKKEGNSTFDIPFARQDLADYLEVERSGLSMEISKLRKEGRIENYRNTFKLLS